VLMKEKQNVSNSGQPSPDGRRKEESPRVNGDTQCRKGGTQLKKSKKEGGVGKYPTAPIIGPTCRETSAASVGPEGGELGSIRRILRQKAAQHKNSTKQTRG